MLIFIPAFISINITGMKKSLVLITIMAALCLAGCSNRITHIQVMQQYKTQQGVLKAFGAPNQKKEGNGAMEWLYDESASAPSAKGWVAPVFNSVGTQTATVTEFSNYPKYVKFTFDGQGNVLSYASGGVDFSKKEANPVGTIFLAVVGSLLALGVVIAVVLSTKL
jgi:hypothetical protein